MNKMKNILSINFTNPEENFVKIQKRIEGRKRYNRHYNNGGDTESMNLGVTQTNIFTQSTYYNSTFHSRINSLNNDILFTQRTSSTKIPFPKIFESTITKMQTLDTYYDQMHKLYIKPKKGSKSTTKEISKKISSYIPPNPIVVKKNDVCLKRERQLLLNAANAHLMSKNISASSIKLTHKLQEKIIKGVIESYVERYKAKFLKEKGSFPGYVKNNFRVVYVLRDDSVILSPEKIQGRFIFIPTESFIEKMENENKKEFFVQFLKECKELLKFNAMPKTIGSPDKQIILTFNHLKDDYKYLFISAGDIIKGVHVMQWKTAVNYCDKKLKHIQIRKNHRKYKLYFNAKYKPFENNKRRFSFDEGEFKRAHDYEFEYYSDGCFKYYQKKSKKEKEKEKKIINDFELFDPYTNTKSLLRKFFSKLKVSYYTKSDPKCLYDKSFVMISINYLDKLYYFELSSFKTNKFIIKVDSKKNKFYPLSLPFDLIEVCEKFHMYSWEELKRIKQRMHMILLMTLVLNIKVKLRKVSIYKVYGKGGDLFALFLVLLKDKFKNAIPAQNYDEFVKWIQTANLEILIAKLFQVCDKYLTDEEKKKKINELIYLSFVNCSTEKRSNVIFTNLTKHFYKFIMHFITE